MNKRLLHFSRAAGGCRGPMGKRIEVEAVGDVLPATGIMTKLEVEGNALAGEN